ncbi:hypothetical protein XENOCAPTIV_030874, partial [Xenoophorus captivus]
MTRFCALLLLVLVPAAHSRCCTDPQRFVPRLRAEQRSPPLSSPRSKETCSHREDPPTQRPTAPVNGLMELLGYAQPRGVGVHNLGVQLRTAKETTALGHMQPQRPLMALTGSSSTARHRSQRVRMVPNLGLSWSCFVDIGSMTSW